jgi:hypothetical protein
LLSYFSKVLLRILKRSKLNKIRSLPIKGSVHELRVRAKSPKTPQFDNVAHIPTPDPREITVADEEWFECRRNPKK